MAKSWIFYIFPPCQCWQAGLKSVCHHSLPVEPSLFTEAKATALTNFVKQIHGRHKAIV